MNSTLMVIGMALAMAAVVNAAVTITPADGVNGMIVRQAPEAAKTPVSPVPLRLKGVGKVVITVKDIDGKEVVRLDAVDLGATPSEQTVSFSPPALGYYLVEARSDGAVVGSADLGIIPPPHDGLRKDSFYASNSWLKTGSELQFLKSLGIKIQRSHFSEGQDGGLAENQANGVWALPIVGYAFANQKTALATKLKQHGPPANFDDFVSRWEAILRKHPEVTTYEFWNEPWIFGWTWADTPARYRELQEKWCKMALGVNPQLRIVAGSSWMFVEDHIEPYPECWKGLLQGTANHPYQGVGLANQRTGENGRSIDGGAGVNRRMGLRYYYITEGGTEYVSKTADGKETKNNIENARNLVTYFVRCALSGAYQSNAQWDIGYGPAWTRSNTTLAVLTHFTEDRPLVADIWSSQELIFGAIFANPKFVDADVKALPRAGEIATRWDVAVPDDRANDVTKVAVIWSLTGQSADRLDQTGTLTIDDASGLAAYDMFGRPIPATEGKLVLPFAANPVYVTSDTLSVLQLRQRVGSGRIAHVTPVNMYALSLTKPADQPQQLAVRVENQLNVDITGTLDLKIPGVAALASARFVIPAGKLAEVPVGWPGVAIDDGNRYGIALAAKLDPSPAIGELDPVIVSQSVSVASFAKRTINIAGTLDNWKGLVPVTLLDSGKNKVDLTQYYLNPNKKPPTGTTGIEKAPGIKVYTAYDDQNVYIAIDGLGTQCTAGQPWKAGLPYLKGVPDGLDYISLCGDYAQLAFGFRERVPGIGRQMDDPYAWKGQFYDTDYLYSAHTSTTGDVLNREWGPETTRGTAYQLATVPGNGPVAGAKIKITGNLYEIAIPRSELSMFDPARQDRFRFSVMVNDGKMSWGETAGVFDYWIGSGSFGPSWKGNYPNQTFFGIEK